MFNKNTYSYKIIKNLIIKIAQVFALILYPKYGNKITNNNSYCIKCATELSQPYVYVVKDFGDEVGLSHLANGVDEFDYFMKTDIQLY